jgi:lipoprotein-anchoring transpeptidase ErfK/SrfK
MASARQSVQDAIRLKIDPGDVPARLDALQPQLDAAITTDGFRAVSNQIDAMMPPLLDRLFIAELGAGKVIVINLARQSLSAYQDGKPVLSTLVTTGRPALPTPPGNYSVLRKNHPWQMVSDFPRSSPYWYPPSWVQYTLWFRNDGYAIHDAPWRDSYGPGTEEAGSHGCVNVPMPIMETLYNWADLGTRVIVH